MGIRIAAVRTGILMAVLSLPVAAQAADGGAALARDVVVKLRALSTEVSMVAYDETTDTYRKQARTRLDELDAPMQAAVDELKTRDAAGAAAIADSWRVMRGSLKGGREFGPGLLNTDYDAKVHGDFDTGSQTVTTTLDNAWKLSDPAASPLEARAELLASKLVANYVQIAGAPFGSFTMSMNSDDSDLGKGVAQLDLMLTELNTKYGQDADKSASLKRIAAKWQFIRTALLKAGKQSTPSIVYKHGNDIVRELATFN